MTRIDFHHDVPDKLATACRLIAQAWQSGKTVLVYAPDGATAARLDRQLWAFQALSFVPHCGADSDLAPQTPVVISATLDVPGQNQVLVNLDGDLPPGFGRFEQLIEIVGTDEADKGPARARFKFYRERGYPLEAHRSSAG